MAELDAAGVWLDALFAAIDRDGVRGAWPWLAEDVAFRFGSFPGGRGRERFAEAWAGLSSHVVSLAHRLDARWTVGDAVICRGDVTYGLADGRQVTVPFANVFQLDGERIVAYLIYVDASPVFGVPPLA